MGRALYVKPRFHTSLIIVPVNNEFYRKKPKIHRRKMILLLIFPYLPWKRILSHSPREIWFYLKITHVSFEVRQNKAIWWTCNSFFSLNVTCESFWGFRETGSKLWQTLALTRQPNFIRAKWRNSMAWTNQNRPPGSSLANQWGPRVMASEISTGSSLPCQ